MRGRGPAEPVGHWVGTVRGTSGLCHEAVRSRRYGPAMRFLRSLVRTRRRILALVAGAVVIVAALGGVMMVRGSSAAPTYRTTAAVLGTIRQTLSLTGNLSPIGQSNVSFQVSGTVTAVDVTVGQQVTAGQVLATVDPGTLQATLAQAQANLTAAEAKQAADGSSGSTSAQQVATARTTLANDETAYTDTVNVSNQTLNADQQAVNTDCGANPPTQSNCQTAQTQLQNDRVRTQQSNDQAAAKVSSDRTALANAESSSSSAAQAASSAQDAATVSQAQQAVTTAQDAVNEATLTAPAPGEVAQVNTAVGDAVSSGSGSASAASSNAANSSSTPQFIILTPGSFEVSGTVSDSTVSEVAVGQNAVVTAAGTSAGLPAVVTSVGVIGTVTSGVATFPVIVQITGSHPALRDGMSASVTVVVNQVVGVLTVPTSAVHTNGATSTVNVLRNGVSTPVVVTVGAADSTRTQILSGLSQGDAVVIATVSSTVPTPTTTTRRGAGAGGFAGGAGGFAAPGG